MNEIEVFPLKFGLKINFNGSYNSRSSHYIDAGIEKTIAIQLL